MKTAQAWGMICRTSRQNPLKRGKRHYHQLVQPRGSRCCAVVIVMYTSAGKDVALHHTKETWGFTSTKKHLGHKPHGTQRLTLVPFYFRQPPTSN